MARRRAISEKESRKANPAHRVLRSIRGFADESQMADFDRLIHERTRLAIISTLAVNESLSFNELKRLVHATDGNLSVHARKLEEAGYITCIKSFEGRIPKTEYRLTTAGRQALERYLNHMEAIIKAARG